MRGLIVLSLAALAVAAPQGYNYPSQQPSNQYLAPAGGSGFGGSGHGGSGFGGSGLGFGGSGSGFGGSGSSFGGSQGYQQQQQQAIVTKNFFIHSAPEEQDTDFQQRDIVVGQPRKNYNVVFVKSPSASSQKTKIRVIPAVNEEKTVVYVLSKKGGENEIITDVQEAAAPVHKPEVHFIKYKTNEEAEHAQQTIQSQYDSLGGTSSVSNEGVGQVQSVIGSLDGHGAGAGAGGQGFGSGGSFGSGAGGYSGGFGTSGGSSFGSGAGLGGGHGSASSAYLPPVKKH